jgi:surfeit locus 1 family protein
MRRIPIIPTLIVLAAVAVMVWLGFWQLDRMKQKETLLAQYNAAMLTPQDAGRAAPSDKLAYRRLRYACYYHGEDQLVAGKNSSGQLGWAHVIVCREPLSHGAESIAVVAGWSSKPVGARFREPLLLSGTLVPGFKRGVILPEERQLGRGHHRNLPFHIVADPPLAGLQPNSRPDPRNIPNNHWSYAAQWFLFALTALVIYALALRKRLNPPRNGEGDHPQDGGGIGS